MDVCPGECELLFYTATESVLSAPVERVQYFCAFREEKLGLISIYIYARRYNLYFMLYIYYCTAYIYRRIDRYIISSRNLNNIYYSVFCTRIKVSYNFTEKLTRSHYTSLHNYATRTYRYNI